MFLILGSGLLFSGPVFPAVSSSTPLTTNQASSNAGGAGLTTKRGTRPLRFFRSPRWRPTQPPLGGVEETLCFGLFLALPVASAVALWAFGRRLKRRAGPVSWPWLVLGNSLVLVTLASPLLLTGEVYFRYFYDTTDSLGYLKVCERWVQRHWRLNGAGCRDNVEYSRELQPGKLRLTFVGDSFTAGHGIKRVEERFPNLLRRAHPEWDIHVLANVGLDTGAEVILMNRAFAQGYQAQWVVLVYCLNDIGDSMPQGGEAVERLFAELSGGGWFVRNSYLLNFLHHRYKAARTPALQDYFSYVQEAYRGPAWEEEKRQLRQFRDVVQSHGGQLAVVTFPFLQSLGPDYSYRFAHDQLAQLWSELNVPYLDLLSAFGDLPPPQLMVNAYDAHPNERANQIAAQAIDSFISRSMSRAKK